MSVDSSSWSEKATQFEIFFNNISVMFPHIFSIRCTMVFYDTTDEARQFPVSQRYQQPELVSKDGCGRKVTIRS
jgi:hypothetical protein